MNKEQQQIIDDAYEYYLKKYEQDKTPGIVYYTDPLKYRPYTQEEFINKCKTDSEFSENWGLKIEERELSFEERELILLETEDWLRTSTTQEVELALKESNIPTKLITITYKNEKIQEETAYPESVSVQQALLKVWNETAQEFNLTDEDILDYEIRSSCWASWISWSWMQVLSGKYFAWKVKHKYARYKQSKVWQQLLLQQRNNRKL